MKYLLAIDIGNSKTEYVIGKSDGEVISCYCSNGANHQVIGYQRCKELIEESINQTLKKGKLKKEQLSYVYIGAAGADSRDDYRILEELFKEVLNSIPFGFNNDGVISLKNGIINRSGLVITCGTGNVNYGADSRGNILRLGGYCQELGDILGAETIAKIVVSRAARSSDTRDYPSILPELIIKEFNLNSVFELEELGFNSETTPGIIKSFLTACEMVDGLSLNIAWEIAKEVLNIVEYFDKNLFINESNYRLVLDGHIFKRENFLVKMIRNSVLSRYGVKIYVPNTPPVFGAFYYGLEALEVPICNGIIKKMSDSYKREINR